MAEMVKFAFETGENIAGKERKCWVQACFPFPTMISKAFFPRIVKYGDALLNSY